MKKNKDIYSWIALFLLVAGDILAVLGKRGDWDYWSYWVIGDIILLIVLGIFAWLNDTKFKFKTLIVTKLLSNATGITTLNALYLIVFAVNFACLGNAILPLFQPNIEFEEAFFPLLVCGVVLLGLVLFFPVASNDKDNDAEYVFVSGISYIGNYNREQEYNSFSLNLVPLVRMIQICEKELLAGERKCRFLIALSNAFNDESYKVLKDIMHVVCPEKEYNISDLNSLEHIKENIRIVIREIIKKEFPSLKEKTDEVVIDFTDPIDYNKDFDIAYNRIEEKVNPLDDRHHELYFNLTPGTSIIGGLMALFSVDGDRKLYIYSQAKPSAKDLENEIRANLFKRELLKPLVKSRIPLENLLSQALESLLKKSTNG